MLSAKRQFWIAQLITRLAWIHVVDFMLDNKTEQNNIYHIVNVKNLKNVKN